MAAQRRFARKAAGGGATAFVNDNIIFAGHRSGEKPDEEILFGDEDVRQTAHPKVIRLLASDPPSSVENRIDDLVRLASFSLGDEARIWQAIVELVPDFILPEASVSVIPMRGAPRKSGGP